MDHKLELYFEKKTVNGDRPILIVCERTAHALIVRSAFYGEEALHLYSALTEQTEFGKILDDYAKEQQGVK